MDNEKCEFPPGQSRSDHERLTDKGRVPIVDLPLASSQRAHASRWLPYFYFNFFRPIESTLKPILKPLLSRNVRIWSSLKKAQQYIIHGRPAPLVFNKGNPLIDYGGVNRNSRPFGVNLAGYSRSEKGVGEAVRAAARALEAVSIPYVINDVVDCGSVNTEQAFTKCTNENPYGINLVHVNADQVPYFAAQRGGSYFQGRYNIGCWFWELSQFPREWHSSFRFFNELWAPTSFIQDSLSQISPIPVVKMPLALSPNLDLIPEVTREDFGLPADKFIFLSILDFASVLERKNPLGLINAFRLAFSVKDDAILVLKVAHSDHYPAELEALKDACTVNNVRIIDGILSRQALNSLLSHCDCYVSLHRSEGYGLTIAEAMTLGKPVIVTAYSGNMDFTTPANSFLVKYQLTEIDRDYGPYRKGLVWADPDLNHAAELMEYVFKNGTGAQEVGQRGKQDLAELFHPRVVGQQIKAHLMRVISEARSFSLFSQSKKSFSSLP